ncbi:unnamed protein product [Adineta ricciae]|uniref:Uncharacterized protein n=1 Tax=Adineta ricciae TaxID=249248 RepID=A0A813XM20_ADIRI|nr:unnamed protein product [Adineta ricciae]CAF1338686.1 unnamed protein product [Adineta ricciae]
MQTSVLQQCWINQQQRLSPTISLDCTRQSDVNSSESLFRTKSSSSTDTIKEFCAKEDNEDHSLKKRLLGHLNAKNCKVFLITAIIGAILSGIALSIVLTFYVVDRSSGTTSPTSSSTTITSTSSTSTSSSTSSSSTSTSTSTTSSSTSSTTSATTTLKICNNGDTAITFDDLSASVAVPNGYNKFDWTNGMVQAANANTSGYYTGIVSKPKSVMNPNANPLTMASVNGSLFTLYSISIAAAWYDNLNLTVIGYNSNAIMASENFIIQVFAVSTLTFNGFSGLDTVIFSTSGGTKNVNVGGSGGHFSMDNICLSFT